MSRLTALAIARPRQVLVTWLAIAGALGLLGLGVESKLHRSDLVIPGTATERSVESLNQQFGSSFDTIVLLRGPAAQIDSRGRGLVRSLDSIAGVTVLAPWMEGASASLRPRPDTALLIVRSQGSFEYVSEDLVPRVRERAARLAPPLRWHVSGYPDIASGIHGGTVAAIERAELLAAPLLLIILLLVFRSPIAAALPLLVGFTAIGSVRGVLTVVNGFYPLDALALNVASMMGLALGVDYALLMVSRFREELAAGHSPRQAGANAAAAAGHTVIAAGVALAVAMVATSLVVPAGLLTGVGIGLVASVVVCVLAALTALPAALALLGGGIDRWAFGGARSRGPGGVALRALRRPALAVAAVVLVVGVLAVPVLALETGPPDPRALAPGSVERRDYVAVERALGAGWIAPYEIAVASAQGPLTRRDRIAAIDRFQRRLLERPDVAAVLGPGQIARRTAPLGRLPRRLAEAGRALRDGVRSQGRLASGLGRIGAGTGELQTGLAAAAVGAEDLDRGGAAAGAGAARLRDGVGAARAALGAIVGGARRGLSGAARTADGIATARTGLARGLPRMRQLGRRLASDAGRLERLRVGPVRVARDELERGLAALGQLPQEAKLQPSYARARAAFATALGAVDGRDPDTGELLAADSEGIAAVLADAGEDASLGASDASLLLSRSRKLVRGLARLGAGMSRLEAGARRLEGGTGALLAGVGRLDGGGRRLAVGIGAVEAGGGRLAAGIGRLAGGAGELGGGVERMRADVVEFRARSKRLSARSGTGRLEPALRSGYFPLAAVDGSTPPLRRTASFALNVDRGGTGARIVVVGYGDAQRAGHPLRAVLDRELGRLSDATGADVRLGGMATGLQDFDSATADRLPLLALTLSLVTFAVLVAVLRSLLLPLLAVVFNLLTVSAAFGVMVLCFQGSDPLLGGPGFVDAITAYGVFSILFGLSIDYEVFLLTRMREGLALTGTSEGAIAYGVERTAGVITGAALIMTTVFATFATTGLTAARQLGLALTVAVLLDATLIRLVLLPAAMRLCGDACWWMPRPGASRRRETAT